MMMLKAFNLNVTINALIMIMVMNMRINTIIAITNDDDDCGKVEMLASRGPMNDYDDDEWFELMMMFIMIRWG